MRRRDGSPLWIENGVERGVILGRADLSPNLTADRYNEAWLQTLLHSHPEVFPTEQIEPGFGDLVPLCRELQLNFGGGRSGLLDNLFATRDGGLVIVETKLWRNPEARRSAVAQAMEYSAAVFNMSYAELEKGVLKARASRHEAGNSLFEIVSALSGGCAEEEFVDAVSHNLSRGRAIIAVVGDGIREDIIPLVNLLQGHAGHRFTFALVELAIFEAPDPKVRIVVPSVLAQTKLIERGVVRVQSDAQSNLRIQIEGPQSSPVSDNRGRRMSIGEDEFYENLEQRGAGTSELVKTFLAAAESLGIYPELKGGLSLKHNSPDGKPLNLGTISKDGFIDTSPATWWDRKNKGGQAYNETIARLIRGSVTLARSGEQSAVRTASGKTPRVTDLLPDHERAWLEAMDEYVRSILASTRA